MKLPAKIQNLLILFTITSGFFYLKPALAQEAESTLLGITAIPPRIEVKGKPGQILNETIKVRNESNTTRFITTNIKDFVVLDNKGTPTQIENLPEGANKWALSSWLQVSPTNLRLKPGETKALNLIIMVPENAAPGAHYAVVLHTPDSQAILNGSGSSIQTNVGTLVYLTIPGPVNEQAKATVTVPNFSEYGPITLKTTVANLGDIHISPTGKFVITDMLSRSFNLLFEGSNIFPQTVRTFDTKINNHWLLGRFKAELQASYGTTGQVLTPVVFFWVFPIRLFLALITIICLLVGIFTILTHKPDSRQSAKDDHPGISALKNKYRD